MDRKCETCEFFEEAEKFTSRSPDGFCRRYPPSWYSCGTAEDIDANSWFPHVNKNEWCGEYKPKGE